MTPESYRTTTLTVQSSIDYVNQAIERHRTSESVQDQVNVFIPNQWILDIKEYSDWIRLQSKFYLCHSNDESIEVLEKLEAEAARQVLERLIEGGFGGIGPIQFFGSAFDSMEQNRPQTPLCEYVRSVITSGVEEGNSEFNETAWAYLQSKSRSDIWRVMVRGGLLKFSQKYGFTDLQDAGVKGVLPARVSIIACALLLRLDLDCMLKIVSQPFSNDLMPPALVDDDSPLSIDHENGILRRGAEIIITPNKKALRVLQVLYDNLEGQVPTAVLKDRVWSNDPDITNDAVRKQVKTAANLLGDVTDEFMIKRDGLSGWRMSRIRSES